MGRDVSQLDSKNELSVSVTFRHAEATDSIKRYAVDKISLAINLQVSLFFKNDFLMFADKL